MSREAPPRRWSTASPVEIVRQPDQWREVATAIEGLLDDPALRASMGEASRERAVEEFSYDVLADRLGRSLGVFG